MSSNNDNETDKPSSFSQKWTRALQGFTKPLLQPIFVISDHAARNPKLYILFTIVFSLGIMVLGLFTNFTEETSDDIWTPQNARSLSHGKWVDDDSNFPKEDRAAVIIVHRGGKNLFGDDENDNSLAAESARRMFLALDEWRNTDRFDELCDFSDYVHPTTGATTCQVIGASAFWNDSYDDFTAALQSAGSGNENDLVMTTMSAKTYPWGGKVDFDQIIGYNSFDTDGSGLLNFGQSYVTIVLMPPESIASESFSESFERAAIDRILDLQDAWDAEPGNTFKVEIIAERSFEDEFGRAVTGDLPLLPLVFILMSVLCIALFARRDKVLSRSWLGFGAVVTVLLAIVASFGLLFVIGVPFTSLTPLLPFM